MLKTKPYKQVGFTFVEMILGIAVLGVVISGVVAGGYFYVDTYVGAGDRGRAIDLAEEALEAVAAIGDDAWNDFIYDQSTINDLADEWDLTGEGSEDTVDGFTRTLEFETVCRDANDDIVDCPGLYEDISTIKITVYVTWENIFGGTREYSSSIYMTNWDSGQWIQTDWSGGEGQSIWLDETKYDSDDNNIDNSTTGEIKLLATGGGSVCTGTSWTFDTPSNYTYDLAKIEVTGGYAQLISTGICSGTADLCNSFGDQTSCHDQDGCSWQAVGVETTVNPDFNTDYSGWSYSDWNQGGGEVNVTGTRNSSGGNPSGWVDINFPEGKNDELGGYWEQSFTTTADDPSATLDFDWQVTDYETTPNTFQLYVFVDTSSGEPTIGQEVWSSGEQTGISGWSSVTDLDLSSYVTTAGTYYLKIAVWLETDGGDNDGPYEVGYDNVQISWGGGSTCSGTPVSCDTYSDETSCQDQSGCYWGGGNLLVTGQETSNWGTGYCYEFIVENTTSSPIYSWQIDFDQTNFSTTSDWNGNFTYDSGHYTVTPDGNGYIGAGDTIDDIGFCADITGSPYYPTGTAVQIIEYDEGDVTYDINVTSDWGTGYCADIEITNNGTETIYGWGVNINLNDSTMDSNWSGNFDSQGGNIYLVTPEDWNAEVDPGETIDSAGFCADVTGGNYLPTIESFVPPIGNDAYPTDGPDIYANTPYSPTNIDAWTTFTETANKDGGEIYYQISDDDGTTWYYWNSSAWVSAGVSDYNTAVEVNENLWQFPVINKSIKFKAFLVSDGTQFVQLDQIDIGCANLQMEAGTVITDENWATVDLTNTYNSPIVVTSYFESNNTLPASTRIRNLDEDSFEIRLQHPADSDLNSDQITYFVIEEGKWTIDGTNVEASSLDTSTVGYKNNWNYESITFSRALNNPVVMHQVMSYNDSNWITTYVQNLTSRSSPPSSTGMGIALNGAEAETSHGSETIGWVAFDSDNTGTVGTTSFETYRTSDSIQGHGNGCYTFSYQNTYSVAPLLLSTQLEMDGNDGGWPVTCSNSDTEAGIHIEEDQESDSERNHTSEIGGFLAFESGFAYSEVSGGGSASSQYEWPFETAVNYSYNSSKIEVTGGNAQLVGNPMTDWWDSDYSYRLPLTVSVGANPPDNRYQNYTVRVSGLDTADLISNTKMQADCDDLRVVYYDGSFTELDRDIISCDDSATEVRFALEADIADSSSDTGYYIYYGNFAASSGPETLNNVYLWFDDTTTDTSSSYTFGRCDAWHGSDYSAWSYDAINDYFYNDTGDNYTGCFRYPLNERDAYIEAEFYHTGCYPTNMTSGLIGRYILDSGSGGSESASHYYASARAHNATCGGGYSQDGDIYEGARAQLGIDGTDTPAIATSQWRKQALAIWGINDTNAKFWDSDNILSFGSYGYPIVSTTADGQDTVSDQEGSGDWGVIGAQDNVRVRNILMRRYTEPEPSVLVDGEEEYEPYPTDLPTIQPASSLSVSNVTTWTSFSETATKNGGEIYYQLSDDGGTTWYYWTGGAWSVAGANDYNIATDVDDNISSFSTSSENIMFKAFLESDGLQQVQLDLIVIAYDYTTIGGSYAPSGYIVSSAFDMSAAGSIETVQWTETVPICVPACSVKLQIRGAADNGGAPDTWSDWYGELGVGTFFTNSEGSLIPNDLNGNQWIQYRAYLESDGANTPTLEEVEINYKF